MAADNNDNLVLFPKTLDDYQIELTRMLELEHYGEAKAMLAFLLRCRGVAEKHHTEWEMLLNWLGMMYPEATPSEDANSEDENADEETDESEEDLVARSLSRRAKNDEAYVLQLLAEMRDDRDPERQLAVLGQLAYYIEQPDIVLAIRDWLTTSRVLPPVQFLALQVLRRLGATGEVILPKGRGTIAVEVQDTPLYFEQFSPGVTQVLERVQQTSEALDPTLAFFAEQFWKEFVQAVYGTPIYLSMLEDNDRNVDAWSAALHTLLQQKLHHQVDEAEIVELYGIAGDMIVLYEQALQCLQAYAGPD